MLENQFGWEQVGKKRTETLDARYASCYGLSLTTNPLAVVFRSFRLGSTASVAKEGAAGWSQEDSMAYRQAQYDGNEYAAIVGHDGKHQHVGQENVDGVDKAEDKAILDIIPAENRWQGVTKADTTQAPHARCYKINREAYSDYLSNIFRKWIRLLKVQTASRKMLDVWQVQAGTTRPQQRVSATSLQPVILPSIYIHRIESTSTKHLHIGYATNDNELSFCTILVRHGCIEKSVW